MHLPRKLNNCQVVKMWQTNENELLPYMKYSDYRLSWMFLEGKRKNVGMLQTKKVSLITENDVTLLFQQ